MDQKTTGPTVFDINKPQTYGATPSARPVIVGHRPIMPDPMVTPQAMPQPNAAKINVTFAQSSGVPAINNTALAAQQAANAPVSDLTEITQARPTPKESFINDQQVTTDSKPAVFGNDNHTPINNGKKSKSKKSGTKFWVWTLIILAILAGAYAAIDKGLVLSSVNLPVHIFKESDTTSTSDSASTATSTTSPQLTTPDGFTATKLVEAGLTFAFPTAWGSPTAITDQGFTKRSTTAKPDATYAFILSFPNNKDIQVAMTSGKYLPPTRAAQYYDFLGWCVGSADAKYYAGVLRYSTDTTKTDTPTTVTCDQGPLSNATKLTSDSIVQTNIKNTDGTLMGDIYTKNLTNASFVVARVKDATQKNADLIKTMLTTIQNIQ
jgi:hypothetical protein